jgi:hypothetical protein
MPALLVEEAELRMLLLEALQGDERVGYPVQASEVCSDQIKDVPVLRCNSHQRFGCGERFGVAAVFAQLTDADHLGFDWRRRGRA